MGKTYQSIVIDAPADHVWKTIRNFHDVSWCPNMITKVEPVGDVPGDHVGAKRVLNGAFHETLQELKDEGRTFAYSITDGPSPVSKADVSNYVGRVTVPLPKGVARLSSGRPVGRGTTRPHRNSATPSIARC